MADFADFLWVVVGPKWEKADELLFFLYFHGSPKTIFTLYMKLIMMTVKSRFWLGVEISTPQNPLNGSAIQLVKLDLLYNSCTWLNTRGGGIIPYMSYIGMCHCELGMVLSVYS